MLTDILTRDEALAVISTNRVNTQQVNAAELDAWISGVSRFLDRKCGPVVKRTITEEKHDGGNISLKLYYRPVDSVTSCTEYWFNMSHALTEETPGGQATWQYVLNHRQGIMYRREVGWDRPFYPGRLNVVTTYVAGRFDDTPSVDEQFKDAARLVLANVWRRERATGGQASPLTGVTFMLPDAAKALLAGELLERVVGLA